MDMMTVATSNVGGVAMLQYLGIFAGFAWLIGLLYSLLVIYTTYRVGLKKHHVLWAFAVSLIPFIGLIIYWIMHYKK